MSKRTENDVGISQYISSHAGFQGIIKARFQDFIVNEINQDGKIVRLNGLDCEINEEEKESKSQFVNVLTAEEKLKLTGLLTASEDESVQLGSGFDKEKRAQIHHSVRDIFPELDSETTTDSNGVVSIKVSKKSLKNRNRGQHTSRKKFCKFVLYKENIGTMSAINQIAKRLRIRNIKSFQYAGTKDKRAITTQEVTVSLSYERLKGLAKLDSSICLGNFSYSNKCLHLGDLQGNHFTIVVRNIKAEEEEIIQALESFKNHGFINYYGMQRFGTTSVATYEIGVEILLNNWEKVLKLLLNEDNTESSADLHQAVSCYHSSGDAEQTLKLIKDKTSIEACFLRGIIKFGKSQLIQAFGLIPRNIRLIYLHSFQSLIWNTVVSNRLELYGSKPVTGDLVYKTKYEEYLKNKSSSDDAEPPEKRTKQDEEVEYRSEKRGLQDVTSLKEEDLEWFNLSDIVLPLPGHSVVYPQYSQGCLYEKEMLRFNLEPKKGMVHKVEDYSMPGAYRNVIVRPSNITHEILKYDSCTEALILTDKDILKGHKLKINDNGKFQALKLAFSLPTSAYATVALREVLKCDLSVPAQNKMTGEHVQECLQQEKLNENLKVQ